MKKLSILASILILIMASCTKSSMAPSSTALKASTIDAVSTSKKSNFELLTAHKWLYVGYYFNYIDSSNKGQLVYRRGRNYNSFDLDRNRVTFNPDGTVDEIDQNGNYIPGTWHFTNNEQTAMVVTNEFGDHPSTIDFLSCIKFEWTGYDVHTHGIMAPAK